MAACWLTQHQLGYLALVGDLHQCTGDIATACADDLGPQILGEQCMIFQTAERSFTILRSLPAELEKADKFTHKGKIALRLDRDGDQIGVQSMSQSPGITDDLAGMGSAVRRSANSRSAVRLPSRKKLLRAASMRSGG